MIAVRRARPADVPGIRGLIEALAVYEREPDAVSATEDDLMQALFPAASQPLVHCHVAEASGELAGIAIWFVSFSTWEGKHGIYLEDLFVDPRHRSGGVGRALLAELAAEAVRRGCPRLEWSVLDWNELARGFYGALGAQAMTDWVPYRVSGRELRALAEHAGDAEHAGHSDATAV